MNIFFQRLLSCLFLSTLTGVYSQHFGETLGGEAVLFAETKQVNQFFRRFNSEEAPNGTRYYPNDSLYHDNNVRRQYIPELFDKSNPYLNKTVQRKFIREVTDSSPFYLSFHGGHWFAEVQGLFLYEGEEVEAILFLQLEEVEVGSKWVLFDVSFPPLKDPAVKNTLPPVEQLPWERPKLPPGKFMHPLSHELSFMNLNKVFNDNRHLYHYASQNSSSADLKRFLYLCRKYRVRFQTIRQVKFHFFQINGWYFELAKFTRSGLNRGWLISSLSEVTESEKNRLKQYIFRKL